MPNYSWPAMDKRRVMGQPIKRLDGPVKASGRAKYNSDVHPKDMLWATLVTSPHAHARITAIDLSPAEKMPGVTAVRAIKKAGDEVQWAGTEIASIAAINEEVARDAARAVAVKYEVLPHLVQEQDLAKAGTRAKPAGEQVSGDPDQAFKDADVVVEGEYGVPVITHCCLESHGTIVQWNGDHVEVWPSTQNVSGVPAAFATALKVPANQIHVHMDHVGGGFGSKFPLDLWDAEAAQLSKASGGKPVKMFLDRETELTIAGVRPSAFAKVKLGAKKDGTFTVWESKTWGSGGFQAAGLNADLFPYVYRKVANRRVNHSGVSLNAGSARAWRAPNHPQVSLITCSALDDLAAKLGMDPLQFFLKNADLTNKPDVYRAQLNKAAAMIEWSKYGHARPDQTKGPIKRGLGIGVNTWGGLGHESQCRITIQADGSVEVDLGSQDLGTATRTMIAMVAAETFGLQVGQISIGLGDTQFPPSGGSGGSTTIGGVTVSTRKAAVNALGKIFDLLATSMSVPADQLEAIDGRIQQKGNPGKAISWKQACAKLGAQTISEMGENLPRNAPKEGLINQGVSGVQMADVSVDIETGIVKMNRMVAVQDCGLVVNPRTAESQVLGACIMSTCASLFEERVMDQQTGRVLNADMEFYKLSGIGDIGEILVHMDISPEHDARGIIGLGEPPAVGGMAAISNAVANAIGVRVGILPLTPNRVLAALANGRNA
ncbi:MAG TPA: xanthine dehydrogenase family protein molybdopterin-binding subunit [Bryobacteraceae bacterium]|nr:xanthine dehydrogenase family protein molybdopterin-binding subunit [Bryobacteraceae bacterium]